MNLTLMVVTPKLIYSNNCMKLMTNTIEVTLTIGDLNIAEDGKTKSSFGCFC